MLLTLDQAAAKLGKTRRQVQYMIRGERLRAEKVGNRWLIDEADLPYSGSQQKVQARKQRKFRAAIEDALDVDPKGNQTTRYSVLDMKAFQISQEIFKQVHESLGKDEQAAASMWQCLLELSLGCHRFDQHEKIIAYGNARDHASEALCHLIFRDHDRSSTYAHRIEQDLMPAIAGLLRRLDNARKPMKRNAF